MDEDYVNLITVKREGTKWIVTTFSNKGLVYALDQRSTKDHAVHVAIGAAIVLGLGNKESGVPLELHIYNWFGKLKGKNSKQSYGHDSREING